MEQIVFEQYGPQHAAEIALCHQVSEILTKHYDGHPWLVGVNHEAGTVNVQLSYLNRLGQIFRYGFQLHINKISTHGDLHKKVMRAGGELLERWRLGRGKAKHDTWQQAKSNSLITDGALR